MKSQVVFIQPIFCPSKDLFEINKKSLLSLLEYLKVNPFQLDICLGGWANDEYWNGIEEVINEFKKLSYVSFEEVKRFKHNFGKSYVVNKLFKNYYKNNKQTKYIFTVDSDIEFDLQEKNIFERMMEAAKKLEENNKHPFGCLTLNLKDNQHNDFSYKDKFCKYMFDNKEEELRWDSVYQGGFAGGALFISIKAWNKMDGYKQYNQTYAPEDAFLFMVLNNLRFSFAIFKTLCVIHPQNVSEEYFAWKKFVMNRGYIIFDKYDKTKYMANIKESEKFWKNYKKEVVDV
jgi:hypothetical protein